MLKKQPQPENEFSMAELSLLFKNIEEILLKENLSEAGGMNIAVYLEELKDFRDFLELEEQISDDNKLNIKEINKCGRDLLEKFETVDRGENLFWAHVPEDFEDK